MVRIACAGGFLGAGKTTALIQAAAHLKKRGLRTAILTNDQGSNLVDTALLRHLGIDAGEITGGCFCCRFPEFIEHLDRIMERLQPDIVLAEAVGSCTDLAATVCRPLRRYYADKFDLAPLSVFVEPDRLRELYSEDLHGFEESVRYLFTKQLAEADLIVANKLDLFPPDEGRRVVQRIQELAGGIPVLPMSARTGNGVEEWVDRLLGGSPAHSRVVSIDYEIYGQAEASLGWLNATVDLAAAQEFSSVHLAESLIAEIRDRCMANRWAIAHLKMLVATERGCDRIAVTSSSSSIAAQPNAWAQGGWLPPAREANLIVNARVGATPDGLRNLVEDALFGVSRRMGISATVGHLESFAPPPPNPPHRVLEERASEPGVAF